MAGARLIFLISEGDFAEGLTMVPVTTQTQHQEPPQIQEEVLGIVLDRYRLINSERILILGRIGSKQAVAQVQAYLDTVHREECRDLVRSHLTAEMKPALRM